MSSKQNHRSIALSAQLIDLGGAVPSEFRVLPCGLFRAKDGRPEGLPGWVMTAASAASIVAAAARQQDAFLIDYDHQTLHIKANGAPAPAAGWFSALEWREGLGLFATDVCWTAAAAAAIEAREYRYISPVLTFHPKSGVVTGLIMAALVNYPALDGLADLAAARFDLSAHEECVMDPEDLLCMLRQLLNLPVTATAEEVAAELDKVKAMITGPTGQTEGLAAFIKARQAEVSALSAQVAMPDPAQFVPLAAVQSMQAELSALSARVQAEELRQLIDPALADGRLLPAQQAWAESLGRSDRAALAAFLETAQPIAALAGNQTGGQAPKAGAAVNFTPPPGFGVDPVQAALHGRIVAYQKEHGTDYLTAALKVGA